MTFVLVTFSIMGASIFLIYKLTNHFGFHMKYKSLILCAFMAFVVNVIAISMSHYLTQAHYIRLILLVLAAAAVVTLYNEYLVGRDRLVAAGDGAALSEGAQDDAPAVEGSAKEEGPAAEKPFRDEKPEAAKAEEVPPKDGVKATEQAEASKGKETLPEQAESSGKPKENDAKQAESPAKTPLTKSQAKVPERKETSAKLAEKVPAKTESPGKSAGKPSAEPETPAKPAENAPEKTKITVKPMAKPPAKPETITKPAAKPQPKADSPGKPAGKAPLKGMSPVKPSAKAALPPKPPAKALPKKELPPKFLPKPPKPVPKIDLQRFQSLDDILDYAYEQKSKRHMEEAIQAYRGALEKYGDDAYAPFIVIDLGNIYKERAAYREAVRVYEDALSLPVIANDAATSGKFRENLAYLRTVQYILSKHNSLQTPFQAIPAGYLREIENEFQLRQKQS